MTSFEELDEESQVELLRGVALEAAPRFGLDVDRMELAAHAFNTTFRLDTVDGSRVALRVNTNSQSTIRSIPAQQAWLRDVAARTVVRVPEPLATTTGRWLTTVACTLAERDFAVVATSWLEGDDVGACDAVVAALLGGAMATLHNHAEGWQLPPGTTLPRLSDPLFGRPDHITGSSVDGVADSAAVVAQAMRIVTEHLAEIAAAGPELVVHGDLHAGNLKLHNGRLGVLDVDDCGIGSPLMDLGTAIFYLRDGEPERESALLDAYAAERPLPDTPPEWLESVLAARQLRLANSLLVSSTPALRQQSEAYLTVTVDRLRGWLDTGRFTLTPWS